MNQLYLGNNLEVLRHHIPDHSVDLIYLDPPFGSHTDYHSGPATHRRTAFVDTWTWNQDTLQHLAEIHRHQAVLGDLLDTITRALHYNGLAAYLVMMTIRLWELHRVLKPRGSFYLHCDPTANGYLRVILDTIFGPENFRSEIVWKRTSNHNDSKKWPRVHDTILFYAGKGFFWHPVYLHHDPEYIRKFYRFHNEQGLYRLHEIIKCAVKPLALAIGISGARRQAKGGHLRAIPGVLYSECVRPLTNGYIGGCLPQSWET